MFFRMITSWKLCPSSSSSIGDKEEEEEDDEPRETRDKNDPKTGHEATCVR